MQTTQHILYCHCAYARVVPEETKTEVLKTLTSSGVIFNAVADLCELSARKDKAFEQITTEGPTKIVACYPRAVKWLFAATDKPMNDSQAEILNMRVEPAEHIINSLSIDAKTSETNNNNRNSRPVDENVKTSKSSPLQVLIYEGEGSYNLNDKLRFEIFNTLLTNGYAVTTTQQHARVSAETNLPILVVGCFLNGTPADTESTGNRPLIFQNIHGLNAEEILQLVTGAVETLQTGKPGSWKPWFPVIDYDRCTNCKQCLSFCLFDVYGVSPDGKIKVVNSDKCKTDCPACSRVCPEVAILFPKYRQGPISGAEIEQQDVIREKMKVDISSLLGGDINKVLRDRSKFAQSRFAKERDDKKALKERLRCLAKLKNQLDIPDEVIMSLPTPAEIEKKATQALQAVHEEDGQLLST